MKYVVLFLLVLLLIYGYDNLFVQKKVIVQAIEEERVNGLVQGAMSSSPVWKKSKKIKIISTPNKSNPPIKRNQLKNYDLTINPLGTNPCWLTSTFGMRRHPIMNTMRMHKGLDYAAISGMPIYAPENGIVLEAKIGSGFGYYVKIRHNSQVCTLFAHCSRFAPGIKSGAKVSRGEVIAYVGSSGVTTGSHLHYEVLYNGISINPLTAKISFKPDLPLKVSKKDDILYAENH